MSSGFKLPKKERLLKPKEFRYCLSHGLRVKHRDISMSLLKNSLGFNRVGFIVPKHRVKLAHMRNRSKRLLREAYRLNKHSIKLGYDMVFFAHHSISEFQEAQENILHIYKKSALLIQA